MDYTKKRRIVTILIISSVVMLGGLVYIIMSNQNVEIDSLASQKNCMNKTEKCSCGISVTVSECNIPKLSDCMKLQNDSLSKSSQAIAKESQCNNYDTSSDQYRLCMREYRNLQGYAEQLEKEYGMCLDREVATKQSTEEKLQTKLYEKCYSVCTPDSKEEKNMFEKLMDSGNTLK